MDTSPEHINKTDSQLLTPDEAAIQLKVTSEHIRALIRRGQLSAVNIGTGSKRPLYRITQRALDEFLNPRPKPEPAIALSGMHG